MEKNMGNKEIIEISEKYLVPTYPRFPFALVRGQGTKAWDADGREFVDLLSGIAVCNLGHCHPKIVAAIQKQAATLLHVSNIYHIEPQALLAKILVEKTFADKVFFCNSGAEANEAAIKLARKFQKDRGQSQRVEIISADMSFHGRTIATLTATGQDKVKIGFDPLPPSFSYVPYDDIGALALAVDDKTAAVILEPIQGEGGVREPSADYLSQARKICDERGALLIFDEVQTGAGRTGAFLACEHYNAAPDICTMAKGLGGGVAIGALLAKDGIAHSFGPGTHASTFGGNPLATAAALAVVETMHSDGILEQCQITGQYFKEQLQQLASVHSIIKDVRGRGLLIGVEFANGIKAIDIVKAFIEEGFLTGIAGEKVLRFAPPLIIEKNEINSAVVALDRILKRMGD